MHADSEQRFKNLKRLLKYFESCSKDNFSFIPEYEAARKINFLVENIENPTKSDLNEIYITIKDLENKEHYDGAGWMDYKMQIEGILKHNGFEIEL